MTHEPANLKSSSVFESIVKSSIIPCETAGAPVVIVGVMTEFAMGSVGGMVVTSRANIFADE